MYKIITLVIAIICIYLIHGYIKSRKIAVSEYSVQINKLPKQFDGFKIMQISDLHNNNLTQELVSNIGKVNPDIIVLTGDVINYDTKKEDKKHIIDIIKLLDKQYPIYYIKGNHEQIIEYYDRLKDNDIYISFEEELISLGVIILNNRKEMIKRENEVIFIYGLNIPLIQYINFEHTKKVNKFTVEDVEMLVKRNNDFECNILLAHNPFFFEEYEKAKFDLVISGHVHGGEIRLPLIGGLISPRRRFFTQYSKGKYTINKSKMVVSAGLGDKTFRIRINNPFDLPVITLKRK